ncbi:MAG: MFS transporter [Lentisphaerae bacterium]|nr:MFS transporter [Lentisphaerota bacterium]
MNADQPPDTGLSKHQTRTSLSSYVLNGAARNIYDVVCAPGGFIFVAFVLALGLPREAMGFLASAASATVLFQVLSVALNYRIRDKKKFVLILLFVEPAIFALALFTIPFLPTPLRIPVLLSVIFFTMAAPQLTAPMVSEWQASTIPEPLRGRFLGRQIQVVSASGMAAMLSVGLAAQCFKITNVMGLAAILSAGAAVGIFAAIPLRRVTLPVISAVSKTTRNDLLAILKNRPFVRLTLGVLLFNFPFYFLAPYYQVITLSILRMNPLLIALTLTAYGIIKIFTVRYSGRYIDRHGSRKIIVGATILYALFFAGFIFSRPDNLWPLFAGYAICGLVEGAWGIAITSARFSVLPAAGGRQAYFMVFNLANAGANMLFALLSVPVLRFFRDLSASVGPFEFGQYHFFFLTGTAVLLALGLYSVRFFPGKPA